MKRLIFAGVLCALMLFVDSKSILNVGGDELAENPEKRQHWSYGFAPGGKRELLDEGSMADELDKRQHWSYGFAPGGKRDLNSEVKRQHWSYGFAPGGKRELNSEEKRQHWSYGFAPGGKRELDSEVRLGPYEYNLPGKTEFETKRTAWPEDLKENGDRRLYWSAPTKRATNPEDIVRKLLLANSLE